MSSLEKERVNLTFYEMCSTQPLSYLKKYFNLNQNLIDINNMRYGMLFLVEVVQKNRFDVAEWLITVCKANINGLGRFTSPLWCAVYNNNVEIVKLLLDNGANTNFKNLGGQTLLEVAREYNLTEIIAILESPMIKSANKV
jgi:hypothetical protein